MSTDHPPPRARIADIIRDSGRMGAEQSGPTQDQVAAIAATISGASAGTLLASEALAEELAKRFRGLSTNAVADSDFDASYETTGRALILALARCGYNIAAAFDSASGAILEAKKAISLLAPAFTMTLSITDCGATTNIKAQAQHTGFDWGQNAKLVNELFAKTNEYLSLFKT
ncbi:MAG TPA: hypothetical protein VIJ77_01940 [Candidatus Tumulicola sp.]